MKRTGTCPFHALNPSGKQNLEKADSGAIKMENSPEKSTQGLKQSE
jgi:hypothetical protein